MVTTPALRFTYQDYLLLPEERRYEILEGDLFLIPTPAIRHQRILLKLTVLLSMFVDERRLGEVFHAPLDVVLSETDVLQPDILFVSEERRSIIGEKFISAAPDLVVEILSPSTAERDQTLKAKVYARFGVRELWTVDPDAESVQVLVPGEGGFSESGRFRPARRSGHQCSPASRSRSLRFSDPESPDGASRAYRPGRSRPGALGLIVEIGVPAKLAEELTKPDLLLARNEFLQRERDGRILGRSRLARRGRFVGARGW